MASAIIVAVTATPATGPPMAVAPICIPNCPKVFPMNEAVGSVGSTLKLMYSDIFAAASMIPSMPLDLSSSISSYFDISSVPMTASVIPMMPRSVFFVTKSPMFTNCAAYLGT